MTDLAQLFTIKTPKIISSNQTQTIQRQTHNKPQIRNLFGNKTSNISSSIQNSNQSRPSSYLPGLKKTQKQFAKTSIQTQSIAEQIQYFKKLSKKQFYQKALYLIAIPLTILGFTSILNKKIAFQLILLGISLLIIGSYLIVQNRTLNLFFKSLPFITFLAVYYDILTGNKLTGQYSSFLTNLPALIISLFGTINFVLFSNFQYLSQKNIRNIQINLKLWQKCKYFVTKYTYRLQNLLKIVGFISLINLSLVFVVVLYLLFTNNGHLFNILIFQTNIFRVIATFWLLDIFVYSIDFIAKQISFFTLKQKFYQVHVFMTLLRLKSQKKNQEQNQKIYQRCLIQLAKQLKVNNEYLDTPVKVNYAINTYCDIFEAFAQNQLKQLNSKINQIYLNVQKNNKIYRSSKSWRQDLFVKIRKYIAQFNNDLLIFEMLEKIQAKKQLLLILVKLSKQTPLRTKIIEGLGQVIQTITKTEKNLEVTFKIGTCKLMEWKSQLNLLIGQMQNNKTGMTLSRVSGVDENGWCHYERKKVLNFN